LQVRLSVYWQLKPVEPSVQPFGCGIAVGELFGGSVVGVVVAGDIVGSTVGAHSAALLPAQSVEQSSPANPASHVHDPSSATAPLLLHVVALLKRQSVSLGVHWWADLLSEHTQHISFAVKSSSSK